MPTQDEPSIVLRLELVRDAEHIRGSLTDGVGRQASFVGWLAFAAAIQRVCEHAPGPGTSATDS